MYTIKSDRYSHRKPLAIYVINAAGINSIHGRIDLLEEFIVLVFMWDFEIRILTNRCHTGLAR
jgi:hypothetical protein